MKAINIGAFLSERLDQKNPTREAGLRVKRLIEILKLPQNELADKLKITPSAVNQIIKGKGISLSTIVKLCVTFNVNAQWLLIGEGEIFINFNKDKKYASN